MVALLARGLRRFAAAQFFDQQAQAVAKAVDIETHRIVVAVANAGIDRGVIGRNEPASGAHAGDRVEQREPVVLRGGEGRVRRLRVVVAAVSGALRRGWIISTWRKSPFSVPTKSTARSNLVSRHGVAKSWLSSMSPVRLTTTWALPQPSEQTKLFRLLNFAVLSMSSGKDAVAEIRSAGIVDDEIGRHRRFGIVVLGARYRLPEIGGKIPFKILLRQIGAQCLARRQAGVAADPARQGIRQALPAAAPRLRV